MNTRTALLAGCLLGCAVIAPTPGVAAQQEPVPSVQHRNLDVDGLRLFYREAGPRDAPVLLLLHGFPSSSHMFRHLIPALSDRYRVIAPDYPGFGYSAFPAREHYAYSFAAYAQLMKRFTEQLGVQRYALYIQDYGAPIGLRLALLAPERVSALIVQNGNAYAEGLSAGWDPLKAYWREPSAVNREKLRGWLDDEGIRQQYIAGLAPEQIESLSPDTWTLDRVLLARPGNVDVQLDLFGDYRSNVELYPQFQAYFRKHHPPTLIVWGRRDPFFTLAGAQAYQRDLPEAELHLLDAGHFALETQGAQIAVLMHEFLARRLGALS